MILAAYFFPVYLSTATLTTEKFPFPRVSPIWYFSITSGTLSCFLRVFAPVK